jgi:signal transduction histidine kinase
MKGKGMIRDRSYEELRLKNEFQINESTAMICLYEMGIVALIYLLELVGVFGVYSFATQIYWKVALVSVLCLPPFLVLVCRVRGRWIKYLIMTCNVLASGLCYVIFNIQALLLFAFPTAMVTMYYNQPLSYYTCILSIAALFASHFLASYLLLPMYYRNPFGYRYVMVDTAIPQCIYYLCFAFLAQVLNRRTQKVIREFYRTSRENEMLSLENETAELRGRIQERERISRDIHNNVGHTITAAIFALEAAKIQRPTEPEAADEKTERAIQRMRESMETIRNSVRMMDERNIMTISELEKLLTLCCRQTEQDSEINIETDFSGLEQIAEAPMSSERVGFLYGMVQECVTNGMKHGGAHRIRLKAGAEEEQLMVEVWNDGKVPDTQPVEGFGLRHLREYTEKAGGAFSIIRGYGFAVRLVLPLENL